MVVEPDKAACLLASRYASTASPALVDHVALVRHPRSGATGRLYSLAVRDDCPELHFVNAPPPGTTLAPQGGFREW